MSSSDPAMVQAFVTSSIQGWRFSFDHPLETGKIVAQINNGITGSVSAAAVAEGQPILRQGAIYPTLKGKPYGSMSEAEWQDTIDKMVNYLNLKSAPKAGDLLTNLVCFLRSTSRDCVGRATPIIAEADSAAQGPIMPSQ